MASVSRVLVGLSELSALQLLLLSVSLCYPLGLVFKRTRPLYFGGLHLVYFIVLVWTFYLCEAEAALKNATN